MGPGGPGSCPRYAREPHLHGLVCMRDFWRKEENGGGGKPTRGLPGTSPEPWAGLEDTLRDKQEPFGSEPAGASLEQVSLCVPGSTQSPATAGREPDSLKRHQVPPFGPRELETQ